MGTQLPWEPSEHPLTAMDRAFYDAVGDSCFARDSTILSLTRKFAWEHRRDERVIAFNKSSGEGDGNVFGDRTPELIGDKERVRKNRVIPLRGIDELTVDEHVLKYLTDHSKAEAV